MSWPRQGGVVGGPARVSGRPHGFSHSLLTCREQQAQSSLGREMESPSPPHWRSPQERGATSHLPVFFFNSPLSPSTQMSTELLFKIN